VRSISDEAIVKVGLFRGACHERYDILRSSLSQNDEKRKGESGQRGEACDDIGE